MVEIEDKHITSSILCCGYTREGLVSDGCSSTDLARGDRVADRRSAVRLPQMLVTLNQQASSIGRTDFRTIEHLLRAGNKKLKLLNMPGVKAAEGVTVERR